MTASAEPLSVPASRAQGRIPDFFIVGHAKCGTTALYDMLRRHPQIFMPEYKRGSGKEPWYFAKDNPQPQLTAERSVAFTGRRAMTLEQYLSLFADAAPAQRVGEASTSYLWSATAAARIAQARPDARIIALLREPASFLRSLHLQLLQNHHESERDFRKAMSLDQVRREGREIPPYSYWPQALIYSDRVRYVEQLRRYHAVFAPEQVLILIYDDFRADNEATVRRVLRFLGVDEEEPIAAAEANPTVGVRSVRLDNLARAVKAGRGPLPHAAKTLIKGLTPWEFRHRWLYPLRNRIVYSKPGPPDEEFMLELRRRFKGEVVALSEYLDRDLVRLWGYDSLD
jgi:Sulfotransferase family